MVNSYRIWKHMNILMCLWMVHMNQTQEFHRIEERVQRDIVQVYWTSLR
jgi:hypothetical protein